MALGDRQSAEPGPSSRRIIGPARSGKTTRLRQITAELCATTTADDVTVICRDRAAAARFETELARDLCARAPYPTTSDASSRNQELAARIRAAAPQVTTFTGLAMDTLARSGHKPRLIGRAASRAIVEEVRHDDWPVGSAATLDAINAVTLRFAGREEVLTHAEAAGQTRRWQELLDLIDRYRGALDDSGVVDGANALALATFARTDRTALPTPTARRRTMLVDDAEELQFASYRFLVTFAADHVIAVNPDVARSDRTWWKHLPAGEEERLDPPRPAHVARQRVAHRSLEGEVGVARLLEWFASGRSWREMAVLAPSAESAAAVARACSRHAIPTAGAATAAAADHPVAVAARNAESNISAAAFARALVASFAEDDKALALLVDMSNEAGTAQAWATRYTQPGYRWDGVVDESLDAVTITSPDRARGRSWPLVLLAGAVEGVLPKGREPVTFFDESVIDGRFGYEPHERRAELLLNERRRFADACSRASEQMIALSAPEPGVMVSRFVESWPVVATALPTRPHASPRWVPQTKGETPIWYTNHLRLSATQIAAFENCPLSFAYQYAVGARSQGGVQARVGTVTHAIFEEFLRSGAADHSYARLTAIADAMWDPAIFDYRPQDADYRRRLDEWLLRWWEDEGSSLDPTRVVAVEHPFSVPVGPHTLSGFIDRVDLIDSSDGPALEVVDYKTGSAPPGGFDDDNLQLAVYHLAAVRDPALAVLGRPRRLRLHYVSAGKNIEQTIRRDHEDRTESRILAAADSMLAEEFTPSPAADCEYCEFARLCPLQPEGRQVGS